MIHPSGRNRERARNVRRAVHLPVYVGVRDYQGALGTLLADYGFAPFTDRAKLVKPVVQWARESALESAPILEPAAHVVAAPFTVPVPPGRPLGPARRTGLSALRREERAHA